MGEAAHKEPSMEDILASIRRIVSEDEPAPATGSRPEQTASGASGKAGVQWGEAARETDRQAAQIRPRTSEPTLSDVVSEVRQSGQPHSVPQAARQPIGGSPAARPQPASGAQARGEVQGGTPRPSSPSPSSSPSTSTASRSTSGIRPAAQPSSARPLHSSAGQVSAGVKPTLASEKPASDRPAPSRSASEREVEAFRGALTSRGTEDAARDSFDRLKRSAMNDVDAKVESILRPMLREWLDDNLPRLVEKLVRAEIERLARKG